MSKKEEKRVEKAIKNYKNNSESSWPGCSNLHVSKFFNFPPTEGFESTAKGENMKRGILKQLDILKESIQETKFYIDYKDQHKSNMIELVDIIKDTVKLALWEDPSTNLIAHSNARRLLQRRNKRCYRENSDI